MKRQLFAAALLGASMFTAPVMLNQSASAFSQFIQLKDLEPNNLKANAKALGAVSPDNFLQIKGNVSRTDKSDVQYFPILPGTKSFHFSVSARGASWALYEDRNRNMQVDGADKLVLFNKSAINIPTAYGKTYLLRVNKSATSSSGSYSGHVSAQALQRKVTVTIHSAKALSKFDPKIRFTKKDRADFFAELHGSGTRAKKTNKVNDNNSPRFSKGALTDFPSATKTVIPYKIKLMDADAGRDDEANISPTSSKSLFIKYRPLTRQVIGPNGKVIGRSGQQITMQGTSGKRASITFSVNHSDK